MKEKEIVPIPQKMLLTVEEAAEYSNIGHHKMREMIGNPNCDFVLSIGRRKLVKRKEFEKYISKVYDI